MEKYCHYSYSSAIMGSTVIALFAATLQASNAATQSAQAVQKRHPLGPTHLQGMVSGAKFQSCAGQPAVRRGGSASYTLVEIAANFS
ncbi:MAG: hypothetical protein ACJ74Z_18950 [Bryobacteraceae bacterium]